MAWRLSDGIVKGEIDNRVRGFVTGRIWLLNQPEPVILNLLGNCHPDMAGCMLTFENPRPDEGDHTDLNRDQDGAVGDMTAARKVRVLDVSVEEASRLGKEGKPIPEHLGNCVYLEWYSNFNGRVVIESTGYEVTISEKVWSLTDEDAEAQAEQSRNAMRDWMERISNVEPEDQEYNPEGEKPMDEFQWEQFMRESDARTESFGKLMEKYLHHPDRDRIIAREMGWTWIEEAMDADEKGVFDDEKEDMDDIPELEPNPLTEGEDWIRREDGTVIHPLQHQATEVAMGMWNDCGGKERIDNEGDTDLIDMLSSAQILGAKLAGALNGLAYREAPEYGFIVASLKRSLPFLNDSIAASKKVQQKALVEEPRLDRFRKDLFKAREEILALMQKFRKRI